MTLLVQLARVNPDAPPAPEAFDGSAGRLRPACPAHAPNLRAALESLAASQAQETSNALGPPIDGGGRGPAFRVHDLLAVEEAGCVEWHGERTSAAGRLWRGVGSPRRSGRTALRRRRGPGAATPSSGRLGFPVNHVDRGGDRATDQSPRARQRLSRQSTGSPIRPRRARSRTVRGVAGWRDRIRSQRIGGHGARTDRRFPTWAPPWNGSRFPSSRGVPCHA
jgi:hypothetical protein